MKIIPIILFLLSGPAIAAGNPVTGQAKAIICIGCHASDGNSTNPIYPRLAGQVAAYLEKQLYDFKSGARKEEHMSSMVEAIDKTDVPDIAAFFSINKPSIAERNTTKSKRGMQIYQTGDSSKGIAACKGCHGPAGKGNSSARYPALAGQHSTYLISTLKEFRTGHRNNDPQAIMRNMAARLSDIDIDAVSNYLENMTPEKL